MNVDKELEQTGNELLSWQMSKLPVHHIVSGFELLLPRAN